MIEFQMLDSDFWGESPQIKVHQLREDICAGFQDLCFIALDSLSESMSERVGKHRLNKRYEDVAGKRVYVSMEVSEHFEAAQVIFKSRNDLNQKPDKFVAYCVYAVNKSFGSHSSAVYENKGGWFECQVALKGKEAAQIISFLEGYIE